MTDTLMPLFCRLDGYSPVMRERQRTAALKNLGLLTTKTIPIFDDVTQMAARFLECPLCILDIAVREELWIKSAVGLSRLGQMSQWAASRKIAREEAYSPYVIDSQQPLKLGDILQDEMFASSILAQHYGIRAYLGVPLMLTGGACIGTLAVMDRVPREFANRDVEFLSLSARWGLGELERECLVETQAWGAISVPSQANLDNGQSALKAGDRADKSANGSTINQIQLQVLQQLVQEMCPSLTNVIGMTSALRGEVLGSLSPKQKDYLDVIHASGQQLHTLIAAILKLAVPKEKADSFELTAVNLPVLCQQAIEELEPIARKKRQKLCLLLESGWQNWLLDRELVQQALFYLVLSAIEMGEWDSEIAIELSQGGARLEIAIWESHQGWENDLPWQVLSFGNLTASSSLAGETLASSAPPDLLAVSSMAAAVACVPSLNGHPHPNYPSEKLALLLSCYLVESHQGQLLVRGSAERGGGYALALPKIPPAEQAQAQ